MKLREFQFLTLVSLSYSIHSKIYESMTFGMDRKLQSSQRQLCSIQNQSHGHYFLIASWAQEEVWLNCKYQSSNSIIDQLCILADTQPQLSPEDEDMISRSGEMEREELKHKLLNEKVKTHEKDTSIAIFRVYDLLVNTFPGLANVSHRGIVREKLINLFGRLSLANLNDPKFEVPLIGPP